jgi:hypothetical protein
VPALGALVAMAARVHVPSPSFPNLVRGSAPLAPRPPAGQQATRRNLRPENARSRSRTHAENIS